MIKQNELVPKRRFEGFTNEWEVKILGNIGQTFTGLSGKTKEDFGHGNAEFVTYMNVFNNPISNIAITENVEIDIKQDEVKYGDVLFTTSSETPHEVGMSSVWLDNRPNVYLNSFCFGYRININIDYLFIAYLFRSSMVRDQMEILAQGISRYNISKNKVMEIKILLPDKKEQQQIGQFFKHLDDMIALQQRKIDKAKALKSAYLAEMFPEEGERIPKRRFEGFTNEWEVKILGNIGKTFTGLSGKTKEDFGHGNAEFVTYMNVFNNPISNIAITENVEIDIKQDEIKYGDVLFTTSSETPHEVGMSSVWLDNRPNVYLNSFCFGYRINIKIDYLFIAYLFRSNILRNQMEILAQGISRYNISKNKVMEIKILLPSKKEQQKIGQFFKHLDEMIATHQQKLEKLKATKQGYLHEMFV